MNRSELLDQILDELDDRPTSSVVPRPTKLSVEEISEISIASRRNSGHHDTKQLYRLPNELRSVLRVICLFAMAFCPYGLFAFFPTYLTKPSDAASLPITSVSANIPSDILSLLTHSMPAAKRYITKSIQDIIPGDTIYATDPETGETVSCHVTQTFVNTEHKIHRLTTMSESGDVQIFGVTAGYPYFILLQNNIAYDQNLWSRAVRFTDEYGNVLENIDIANDSSDCYLAASDLRPSDQLLGPSGELSTVQYNQYEPHPEGILT